MATQSLRSARQWPLSDDGVGGADPAHRSGLRGIADRVAALGGIMTLDSPAGQGTRLVADLPCG